MTASAGSGSMASHRSESSASLCLCVRTSRCGAPPSQLCVQKFAVDGNCPGDTVTVCTKYLDALCRGTNEDSDSGHDSASTDSDEDDCLCIGCCIKGDKSDEDNDVVDMTGCDDDDGGDGEDDEDDDEGDDDGEDDNGKDDDHNDGCDDEGALGRCSGAWNAELLRIWEFHRRARAAGIAAGRTRYVC